MGINTLIKSLATTKMEIYVSMPLIAMLKLGHLA